MDFHIYILYGLVIFLSIILISEARFCIKLIKDNNKQIQIIREMALTLEFVQDTNIKREKYMAHRIMKIESHLGINSYDEITH